ncbi:MAG: helix-turn-helix domain-containing protein [Deltaproteobacteria bacterium]|nr:helix-turn-helix domain-containing protein [Deltaproteobacteria bacterium]
MIEKEETFYEVLKVPPKATVSEIVAAYHAAKNAFSRDSMATYSLFDDGDIQKIQDRLEVAYQTLSNLEKRAEYDRKLNFQRSNPDLPVMETTPVTSAASGPGSFPNPTPPPALTAPVQPPTGEQTAPSNSVLSGAYLSEIRQQKGLSLEDVTRVTKIPLKFIRAIEDENVKKLPARVYVQGFVKNLASLYKLPPQTTVKSYMENIDKKQPVQK